MKTMKKLSVFLLVALVMAISVVPTFAANVYTPLSGGTYTITEELYLEKSDTIVPTVEYTLAISNPTAPVKEDGTTPWGSTAFANTTTGAKLTTNKVSFSPSSTVQSVNTPATGADWERYVSGSFVLDFSDVKFKEPGIFRYNLTKSVAGADAADVSNTRAGSSTATESYVLLFVTEKNDGTLTLDKIDYINSNSTETAAGMTLGKTYKDQYPAIKKDLTVSKTVTGNQGSKTQYFKFTIELSGGVAGAKYKVSGTYDATTAVTEYNSTAYVNNTVLNATAGDGNNGFNTGEFFITLDADGKYSGAIWMQHGQSVTIEKLPKNMAYTVDEDASTRAGYTESLASGSDAETGTIEDADIHVKYNNEKTGNTPTGILLQVGAPIAGVLLVGALFIVLMVTKRRKEQEAAN